MFGMMGMGDLEDDPIFGHHMRSMRQMNSMMNTMFADPFAGMFGGMSGMPGIGQFDASGGLMGGPGGPSALTGAPMGGIAMLHQHHGGGQQTAIHMGPMMQQLQQTQQMQRNAINAMMPFGAMGGFGGGPAGGGGIPHLNRLLMADMSGGVGAIGGRGTSFSSSQVVTMSRGPDGRPQVYKATSSTKTGPGGVRETQKTVQDSRSGVKKMAIGHHIGERSHVIERERNYRTGAEEERQDFVNLEEDEADEFNREFAQRSRSLGGSGADGGGRAYRGEVAAIMPAPSTANGGGPLAIMSAGGAPVPVARSVPAVSSVGPMKHQHQHRQHHHHPHPQSQPQQQQQQHQQLATARRPIRTAIVSSPLTTSIHPHPYGGASTSAGRRQQRAAKAANSPSPQQQHSGQPLAPQQQQQQHRPSSSSSSMPPISYQYQQQQQQRSIQPRHGSDQQWTEEPL